MKKLFVALIAAIALAGVAAAQSESPSPAHTRPQSVTVTGKLELINGEIGLMADGVTYYVPRLRGVVGFIKDLQEGATVTLEGYAHPIRSEAGFSMLMVKKLSIGGRDYDLGKRDPFDRKWMHGEMDGGTWGGQG
ncbi:MAG: hypothetical protein ABSF43_12605 [Rectinemataceae bacterium]|jgi:hypothetical protein